MELKKYFYEKFKYIFKNEINSENNNKQDMKDKELFEEFISSFDNEYIDKNQKDLNFRKQFIRKYCNYLFFNNIVNSMTCNNAVKDINVSDIEKFLNLTHKEINLGEDTIYITHPWKGKNLTGNTNAYRGVVYNGFVFDEITSKFRYIYETKSVLFS